MKILFNTTDGCTIIKWHLLAIFIVILLTACSASNPPKISSAHLSTSSKPAKGVPAPIMQSPYVPIPTPRAKLETYTVVVSEVPVKDLLFSMARDAKVNVDIHPTVTGKVTINAVNQTLAQILNRISKQVDLRYQVNDDSIVISPDLPYWQNYRIDYINLERKSTSEVSVTTQISNSNSSTSGGSGGSGGGGSGSGGNQRGNKSKTKIETSSTSSFWKTITKNLKSLVGDSSEGGQTTSSRVVAHPATGIVAINTTQKLHKKVQEYIEAVMSNAQRQVLIEITIVEVELNNRYQAGIDWQRLSNGGGVGSNGLSIMSNLLAGDLSLPPVFSLGYNRVSSNTSSVSGTLKSLETFGNVKVLSSPKLMALNNQTALLKVVDEEVFFTIEQETSIVGTTAGGTSITQATYTSRIHTVPIGIIMSVLPQINRNGFVSLNIRPTVTRIVKFGIDPAPALNNSTFVNRVPVVQVREMESLIQVANGQTIIMGGLMQNKIVKKERAPAGLRKLIPIRKLLSYKDQDLAKTELVVFLKPTIIRNGRTESASYRQTIPTNNVRSSSSHAHKGRRNAK